METNFEDYPFELRRGGEEDGGGWFITFPDLPGCMSDGESIEEAIENGRDACKCYVEALREWGRPIPEPVPFQEVGLSGRVYIPASLHDRLAARARQEGVSMNTLAVALLAEGLGKKKAG
jgi:antitoxin HicB